MARGKATRHRGAWFYTYLPSNTPRLYSVTSTSPRCIAVFGTAVRQQYVTTATTPTVSGTPPDSPLSPFWSNPENGSPEIVLPSIQLSTFCLSCHCRTSSFFRKPQLTLTSSFLVFFFLLAVVVCQPQPLNLVL